MLIDDPAMYEKDWILMAMAAANGRSPDTVRVAEGVFEVGHFGSSNWPIGFEQFPDLSGPSYGVCDHYSQIVDAIPELNDPDRKFAIAITQVRRGDQPLEGGWRWHKWGEYIGTKTPTTEYLHDEPDIDQVYVYHVYEKIS